MLLVTACNFDPSGQLGENESGSVPSYVERAAIGTGADSMASNDLLQVSDRTDDIPDSEKRPTMQLQVVLDRLGFTPGVVDGKVGMSTRNAIKGFQEANDLEVSGALDDATKAALAKWKAIPATRVVSIPEEFAEGPFTSIPDDPKDQAKIDRLGYETLDEKLAERFHTSVEVLNMLNPGGVPAGKDAAQTMGGIPRSGSSASASPSVAASVSLNEASAPRATDSYFRAGQQIRVPNIGADRIVANSVEDVSWGKTLRDLGVGTEQPKIAKIVVSKSAGTLKGYDKSGKLVAMYSATMGSRRDPLPLGNWKVLGIAHNPPFSYDPELFWDVPDEEEKQMLPPGPNGPVGVVWIDISKEHYGIHGTPEPQTIGRVQSHGCIRLTNWDAARLAQMVSVGTQAVFEA